MQDMGEATGGSFTMTYIKGATIYNYVSVVWVTTMVHAQTAATQVTKLKPLSVAV